MFKKLLGFLKDNGLGIMSSIISGNPIPATISVLENLGIGTDISVNSSKNKDELLDNLSGRLMKELENNPDTLVKLRELKLGELEVMTSDRSDARDNWLHMASNNDTSFLNKNIREIMAIFMMMLMGLAVYAVLFKDLSRTKEVYATLILTSIVSIFQSVNLNLFGGGKAETVGGLMSPLLKKSVKK